MWIFAVLVAFANSSPLLNVPLLERSWTIFTDIGADPEFIPTEILELANWNRKRTSAISEEFCASLEPLAAYQHHAAAVKMDLLSHLPYMGHANCGAGPDVPWTDRAEHSVTGKIRNVLILPDGAMISTLHRNLHIPHYELYPIKLDEVQLGEVVIADSVLNLRQLWSHNYFHAMLEVAPRLIRTFDVANSTHPTVLVGPLPAAVWEFLELLGISQSSTRNTDHKKIVFARNCWLSTYSPYRFPSEIPRETVQLLLFRSRPILQSCQDVEKPRTIVISTRRGSDREVTNWDEIMIRLQNEYPEDEIVMFEGSQEKMRTQMCTFARAKIVIGVSGANLVNILWMPGGTSVIEIFPPPSDGPRFSFFWHLASTLDLQHFSIPIETTQFELGVEVLLPIVKKALQNIFL